MTDPITPQPQPTVIYVNQAPKPPSNPMALASLITAGVSLPLVFCCGIGFIGEVVAIGLGVFGFIESKKLDGLGKNYALGGILTGAATIVLFGLLMVLGMINNAVMTSNL